jgi:hypothetical protein
MLERKALASTYLQIAMVSEQLYLHCLIPLNWIGISMVKNKPFNKLQLTQLWVHKLQDPGGENQQRGRKGNAASNGVESHAGR